MTELERPPLRPRFFVALQHWLPQHFLSRIVYRVTRIKFRPIKNLLIRSFVRHFKPNMEESPQPVATDYPSFNAFFTRGMRPGMRQVDLDPNVVVSPVDGTVSQIGQLDGSQLIQAKGHDYTLEALFAGTQHGVDRFRGGSFATLYLAPYNYHRVHMPLAGELRAAWFVPGKLFSVNAVTAAAIPNLFTRNERVVCLFEDGPRSFAMVLVGALLVGSIATVWHGDITPYGPRRYTELPIDRAKGRLRLTKGTEMGRFNMGSTVILVLPPGLADWVPRFKPNSRIQYGDMLARLRAPMEIRPQSAIHQS